MLELKHSTMPDKYKGSPELKSKLLNGDVKAISEALNIEYTKVNNVLSGNYYGERVIVECAERLAALYDELNLTERQNQILKEYGTIDQ